MSQQAYYYRDPAYLYPLQSHPTYWFHVGRSSTKQAIFGLLGTKFCAIIFSIEGDLIEHQENPLEISPSSSVGMSELDRLEQIVTREVIGMRSEYGLTDRAIQIKRFQLPDLRVGIYELPKDLQEYVVDRGPASLRETDLEEALEGWKEESLFVFWWGQSFSVDCEGIVSSS